MYKYSLILFPFFLRYFSPDIFSSCQQKYTFSFPFISEVIKLLNKFTSHKEIHGHHRGTQKSHSYGFFESIKKLLTVFQGLYFFGLVVGSHTNKHRQRKHIRENKRKYSENRSGNIVIHYIDEVLAKYIYKPQDLEIICYKWIKVHHH